MSPNGGSQDAPDGGLDVRVQLASNTVVAGFVPRAITGFQVKKPDMPPSAIAAEMTRSGPSAAIGELAASAGAYVIVSSGGSSSDSSLERRRIAMRSAASGVPGGLNLHVDFYDRTRIATWVRSHPGLVAWTKERVGRGTTGWRGFGPWATTEEAEGAEYLLDDELKIQFGSMSNGDGLSVQEGVAKLREVLSRPKGVVRLVGLSGVGKTRLVQSLFDERLGVSALPKSQAVYANVGDAPVPSATSVASDLLAIGGRAILVIDNCPTDLHHAVSEVVRSEHSKLSVITVEYDIREDKPEGTSVVSLQPSSDDLIERLISKKHPAVSQLDARAVAKASGGNARVALAIAGTIEQSDSVQGLSDQRLFERLFLQRHVPNERLLHAASVFALVYSFDGETMEGGEAELPILSALAGQGSAEMYAHIGDLLDRNLVQRRGKWRAVLPHAIANKLAARALSRIPVNALVGALVESAPPRLAKSFSRRLSYLHNVPAAEELAKKWLGPGGLLAEVSALNELGREMLENIAPVTPTGVVDALKQIAPDRAGEVWGKFADLLRLLAYDAEHFNDCVAMLIGAARETKVAEEAILSFMHIHLSGTHATIEQRAAVVRALMRSDDDRLVAIGQRSLGELFQTGHFSTRFGMDFGARSRDFGFYPKKWDQVRHWFRTAISIVLELAGDAKFGEAARDVFCDKLFGLWFGYADFDHLSSAVLALRGKEFWPQAWLASRRILKSYQTQAREGRQGKDQISHLEVLLRPVNLCDRVRAMLAGSAGASLIDTESDLDPATASNYSEIAMRKREEAVELGQLLAGNPASLSNIVRDLVTSGGWASDIGRGLIVAADDPSQLWDQVAFAFSTAPRAKRDASTLRGMIGEIEVANVDLANRILDAAARDSQLKEIYPILQCAVSPGPVGTARLLESLKDDKLPLWPYRSLAFGRASDAIEAEDLAQIILAIARKADGFPVASEVLSMRLYSDRSEGRPIHSTLARCGRELLAMAPWGNLPDEVDFRLGEIATISLQGDEGQAAATTIVRAIKSEVDAHRSYFSRHDDLLKVLFKYQPSATLDTLLSNPSSEWMPFDDFDDDHRQNPAGELSVTALKDWCDIEPVTRYPLAATLVPIERKATAGAGREWSAHSAVLIENAPELLPVMSALIERFQPSGWSGSLADILESRMQLLDQLPVMIGAELASVVKEADLSP